MRIVFFGTSSFAAEVLKQLSRSNNTLVAVVTKPDRLQGRHLHSSFPPVKETALALSLPLFQPEKASDPAFVEQLLPFNADLFVVVAYGEIIKKNLLDMPRLGCINIHASLLPQFRGAAPMQRALMAGAEETGISIIAMTPEMDAGDILAIESIPVPQEMTLCDLEPQLQALSVKLLLRVIEQLDKGTLKRTPQDHSLATFAPKLTPEEEKIEWTRSAQEIHNQIRALSPTPGAWCQLKLGNELKRLKIKKSIIIPNETAPPGTFLSFGKEGWIIACGKGALKLLQVQLEGKKTMSAEEFTRGLHISISMQL